jgi:parallel beta-helix repeat protein
MQPTTYDVSGRVVDSSGSGIADVDLVYTGDTSGTTTSLDDGTWYVSGLKGRVTITASKGGWTFDPANYTVTGTETQIDFIGSMVACGIAIETIGEGVVTISPDKQEYFYGDSVSLQASPVSGWNFSHWEGDLIGSDNPATLIVDGLMSVRAVFVVSIQAAIDTAQDGETIVIPPGVYRENIDFKGKNVTVRSTNPLDPDVVSTTILDGKSDGTVVTFRSGEKPSARLEGFTITNGTGKYIEGEYGGGGVLVQGASPTIAHNVVTGNSAHKGSGIYVVGSGSAPRLISNAIVNNTNIQNWGSEEYAAVTLADGSAQLTGNTISNNSCIGLSIQTEGVVVSGNTLEQNGSYGIWIWNWSPTQGASGVQIRGNTIKDNANTGIRVYVNTAATITENTIQGNRNGISGYRCESLVITDNVISDHADPWGMSGKGIILSDLHSPAIISGNTIEGNEAHGDGGGISLSAFSGPSSIVDNRFLNNTGVNGGAIHIDGELCRDQTASISGNLFVENSAVRGGAVYLTNEAEVSLIQNSFVRNVAEECGGAVYKSHTSTITSDANNTYSENVPDNIYLE